MFPATFPEYLHERIERKLCRLYKMCATFSESARWVVQDASGKLKNIVAVDCHGLTDVSLGLVFCIPPSRNTLGVRFGAFHGFSTQWQQLQISVPQKNSPSSTQLLRPHLSQICINGVQCPPLWYLPPPRAFASLDPENVSLRAASKYDARRLYRSAPGLSISNLRTSRGAHADLQNAVNHVPAPCGLSRGGDSWSSATVSGVRRACRVIIFLPWRKAACRRYCHYPQLSGGGEPSNPLSVMECCG